jgi:hypothetical protein
MNFPLIQFIPIDEDMNLLGNAVSILNDFKKKGFNERSAFVELVMDLDPTYKSYENIQKLQNFWAGRVKDKLLNRDLIQVLEKIKNE